jgi:hypothetical protein
VITFINPLDTLGFDVSADPDPAAIKKARRRLLVEIDLAGGELKVGEVTLSRSDLVRALEDLDNEENVRLYHALQRLPGLNRFLQSGDLAFFRNGGEYARSYDESLVRLVSPHFAKRYGQALARAVREREAELARDLTACAPLVTPADVPLADRPVDAVLGEIRKDLDTLWGDVKAELLDPEDALVRTRLLVSVDALNALPPRFSTRRSHIARAIRNLAIAAFNVHDAVKPAYVLLSDAARIEASVDVAEDIARQLEVVREARDELLLREQYADEVAKCTDAMTSLHSLTRAVEDGDVEPAEVLRRVSFLVDTRLLNSLPDALSVVVVQVALALRGLAVTLWNECDDALAARAVLSRALMIRLPPEAKQKLDEDKATLDRLMEERTRQLENEKADLRKLKALLQGMTQSVSQHRGDQVRWDVVSERLCELFSPGLVGWLKVMRAQVPTQVMQVLVALAPLLAGLANFHPRGYENVVRRLQPLTSGDRHLESAVSRSSVASRVVQDPVLQRATRRPEIWEQTWVWWVVFFGVLFLLGQCGA